jgi:membrane dipeptidase
MLDFIRNMIKQHPDDLQYAYTSQDIKDAHRAGKIASLIGMEGTHFLGNSLGVLRIFAEMGVRYVTLTHVCHSAFASSAGAGVPLDQVHPGNALTDLGKELIAELNRLGILVDLSHTSDETAKQAIALSKAPVIWTHSASRAMWDHARNVPDDVLAMIGDSTEQKDGLVQSVFYPPFIGPTGGANLTRVADHIEYIAGRIGKDRVGIASDFDGMYAAVDGLEDVSKYPDLASSPLMFIARANILRLRRCCFEVGQSWK